MLEQPEIRKGEVGGGGAVGLGGRRRGGGGLGDAGWGGGGQNKLGSPKRRKVKFLAADEVCKAIIRLGSNESYNPTMVKSKL